MLLLPAAALCCLCSALVAMETGPVQDDLTLTRRTGETVIFSCGGADRCDRSWFIWYQKKETFRHVLGIYRSDGQIISYPKHPQKDDFSAVLTESGSELKIEKVKVDHSATYYCNCLKSASHRLYYGVFGSGTTLIVTDERVVQPVLSVYPAASSLHPEGSSSLLCLASAMFPPLVRFSWRRQKENGLLEELPPAEGEQLELRESGLSASIRVLDRDALRSHKYSCYVEHEGGRVEAHTQQEVPALLPPPTSLYQVRLLLLLYTVLIVKSLLYCCGLCLLMTLTFQGPSSTFQGPSST
ncbi:immunoglobulin lambda-1 light chain-like [Parambassis ranga]|uniref:immunoglobulin lambda-1 light chain-like n=1 Tax=Parambassis ranga TaxID=210632 RepID=UPI0010422868|nr:immunoglobulin lambda-1 light chain-like [Parambassis ranga]